ncbi:MAG: four helix bundle protein [Rickettsiales bacterium]|jgi:four helix bundle protein|nr:four helix bundle protein [Rickettsiales bacterium]
MAGDGVVGVGESVGESEGVGEGVGMKSVEDLDVYNLGIDTAVDVYKIMDTFPKSEMFGLVSQMKRAVVSITSNLAEGASRNTSNEYRHFVGISKGSAAELRCQMKISHKLGFIDNETYIRLTDQLNKICRMLTGLINSLGHTPTPAPTQRDKL